MSRIIVKNIPKYIEADRLKTMFEKYGDVTDVKIVTREGKNRKFCFIGFKDSGAGAKAKDFYNNTFIDTSRISVDLAMLADDPNLPRPWSRYSKGSSAFNLLHGIQQTPREKKREDKEKEAELNQMKEDKKKKFLEFLNVMKGSNQTWNDDVTRFKPKDGEEDPKQKNKKGGKKNGKGDEMEEETEGKTKATKTVKEVDSNVFTVTDIDTRTTKAGMAAKRIHVKLADPEEEVKADKKGKKKDVLAQEMTNIINEEKEEKKEDPNKKPVLTSLPADEKRLFVLNLPYSITEDEFQSIFEKFGQIVETKLPKDDNGRRRGYGYVTFLTEEAAISAFAELDNKVVLGRILHIKPAYAPKKLLYQTVEEKKAEEAEKLNRSEQEKSSFKKSRKAALLQRLDDDTNWNTLFLNPNTILAEMASRLNIKKSDILGESGENPAVKVALAETQIINETKEWLQTNGLNLDAFTGDRKSCERSNTVILVKNLPYSVTVELLFELFNRYGSVYKVHLPPTKAVAVIEFTDAEHAGNAFQNLSYYEMKDEPLYLEWAPLGLVQDKQKKANEEMEEMQEAKSRTLFVKNLNFETTEETIKETFEKERLGKFTIKIVKKPNKLSSGYGFIEFELAENASKALKKLQHKIIDGHAIQLSISNPVKEDPKPKNKNKRALSKLDNEATAKIMVRNVAFEATPKEIRELFKTFGEVKSVRMPKKINGQHRGFAFVEFVSIEEAKGAFSSLNHTHLYGRKLNLEFSAAEDDSMEEMTKKIKAY